MRVPLAEEVGTTASEKASVGTRAERQDGTSGYRLGRPKIGDAEAGCDVQGRGWPLASRSPATNVRVAALSEAGSRSGLISNLSACGLFGLNVALYPNGVSHIPAIEKSQAGTEADFGT